MHSGKQDLRLITVSGAHATGKTTLVEALCAYLGEMDHPYAVAESMASEAFRRVSAGVVLPPEGIETSDLPDYDSIDRAGVRGWFQSLLPGILAEQVKAAAEKASSQGGQMKPATVIVDRWFVDIHVYTMMSVFGGEARRERAEALSVVREAHDTLVAELTSKFDLYRDHWFIPEESCTFERGDQDGKFRGTCDPTEWSTLFRYVWHDIVADTESVDANDDLQIVAAPSVMGRVYEVMGVEPDNPEY